MGIKAMFQGVTASPPEKPDKFHAIAKALDAQTGISGMMNGYGNQAQSNTATGMQTMPAQQMREMLNRAQMPVDPRMVVKPVVEPIFKVRHIRNGFLLAHTKQAGYISEEDFCADMAEVGHRVTALLVQYMLEDSK